VISGIFTAVLLIAFLGIFFWAYAPSHKQRFADAAALALADDVRREETQEQAP
jgi:cytochrome c oxidase cbb3-type subunit 4